MIKIYDFFFFRLTALVFNAASSLGTLILPTKITYLWFVRYITRHSLFVTRLSILKQDTLCS